MGRKPARAQEKAETLRFLIHEVGVELNCDHEEAAERIQELFSAYLAPGEARSFTPKIKVEITRGSVLYPVPLHAERVLRYSKLRSYFWQGWTYFTDYFSTLTIDPEGKSVRGNLSPDTEQDFGVAFFVDLLFTLALFEALRFHGLFYLHAAALQGPDGTGYLISGNAGSGKTSLTLSLIHSGFKFLSDDTVFLRLKGEKDVEVLGLLRDFHVPEDLIQSQLAFNDLARLPDYSSYKRKKRLRPGEWFPAQTLSRLENPAVLLFPRLKEEGKPVEPLTKNQALTELLPQSLSVLFHPALARPHLEALRRVLHHGQGFRLRVPEKIKGDPQAVLELVLSARSGKGEPK